MPYSLAAIDAGSAFDTMGDIAYIVDAEGRIADYTSRTWDRFALGNEGPGLAVREQVIGRPLLDFVTGAETQDSYRAFHELLLSGRRERVTFFYRCDAPEVQRSMRMVIVPVGGEGAPAGVLYHSVVLQETMRPALGFLRHASHESDESGWPIVSICSYCKNIQLPAKEAWVTPDIYYREGGGDRVRLSHSICPACFETIVEPALQALE